MSACMNLITIFCLRKTLTEGTFSIGRGKQKSAAMSKQNGTGVQNLTGRVHAFSYFPGSGGAEGLILALTEYHRNVLFCCVVVVV